MPPSRRTVLGAIASSVLPLTAGCTVAGFQIGSRENSAPSRDSGSEFEVWLEGPDDSSLLFDGSHVATVGKVEDGRAGVHLPITLTEDGTSAVSETMRDAGVDKNPDNFEFIQRFQGKEVYRASISPDLAENIAGGDWDGDLLLVFEDREQAENVRDALISGKTT